MSTQHQQQADDSLQRGGEPGSKEIDLPASLPAETSGVAQPQPQRLNTPRSWPMPAA